MFRSGSLLDDLKKAVAERALDAEMDAHLEHKPASGNLGRYTHKTATGSTLIRSPIRRLTDHQLTVPDSPREDVFQRRAERAKRRCNVGGQLDRRTVLLMNDPFDAVWPQCHSQCEILILVPNSDLGAEVGFLGNFDSHVDSSCSGR